MEADTARKQEVRAWESRWGKRLALLTLLGIVIVSVDLILLGIVLNGDGDAATLADVYDKSSTVLLLAVVRAVGFLLIPAVLVYLYKATQARREEQLPSIVMTVPAVAAVMLAAGSIFQYFAIDKAADDFHQLSQGASDVEKIADDVLDNVGTLGDFAAFLPLGGLLLLGLFALLSAMWAMRAGLLSRFWGTFGMATAAFFFLIPNFPYFFFIYLVYLCLLAAGWLVQRPPAWEAVEAIPWPVGGMRPDTDRDNTAIDVEGREVDLEGDPHNPPLPEAGGDEGGPGVAGEPPRKRKRRS